MMFFLKFKKIYYFSVLLTSIVAGLGYFIHSKLDSISTKEIQEKVHEYTGLSIKIKSKDIKWKPFSLLIQVHDIQIFKDDNKILDSGHIDNMQINISILKTLLNFSPIIDNITVTNPVVNLDNSNDEQYVQFPVIDHHEILSIFTQLPYLQKLIISNAHINKKSGEKLFKIIDGIDAKLLHTQDAVEHANKIINLQISADVSNNILNTLINKGTIEDFVKLSLDTKIEYLQNNPLKTETKIEVSNINYNYAGSLFRIKKIGANLNWKIKDFINELEFDQFYVVSKNNKMMLDKLKILANYNTKAKKTNARIKAKYLDIGSLLSFLNIPGTDVSFEGNMFDISKTSLLDLSLDYDFDGWLVKKSILNSKITHMSLFNEKSKVKFVISSGKIKKNNNAYVLGLERSSLFFPKNICSHTLKAHSLIGEIKVKNLDNDIILESEKIQADVCGVNLDGSGLVKILKDSSPYVNIKGEFNHKDMSLLLSDITSDYVEGKLLKWLRKSLPSQNSIKGDFIWNGKLDKFPYEKEDGLIQIKAKMKNITFDFDADWERARHTDVNFIFTNNKYDISIFNGYLDEVSLGEASTMFKGSDDLDDIIVDIKLKSDIDKAIKYLHKSPLKNDVPDQKLYYFNGKSFMGIKLRVPLSDNVDFELKGNARIEDGSIFNKKTNQYISKEFIGDLQITKGDVSVSQYTPEGNKNFLMKITGRTKIDLNDSNKKSYLKYDAKTELTYKNTKNNNWQWRIKIEGDNQRHAIEGIEKEMLVSVSRFRVKGIMEENLYDFKLVGENNLFGSYYYNKKRDQKTIMMRLKKVNPFYLTFYNFIVDGLSTGTSENFLEDKTIDLEIEDLDVYSNIFKKLSTNIKFSSNKIFIDIKGKDNSGKILYSPKDDVWLLNFKRMSFFKEKTGVDFDSFEYGKHASFKGKINSLSINDKEIGELEMIYNPRLDKEVYNLKDNILTLENNEENKYNLSFKLFSKNFENFLQEMDYTDKVISKSGEVEAKVKWPINKKVIHFKDLSGEIIINLDDGRLNINRGLSNKEEYFGKLISILNVAAIPKRLTLDFKDITTTDFIFEKMAGNIYLEQNNYHTNNLNIVTTSALFGIDGNINKNTKIVDFKLSVIPKLTGGIPLVALIAGGPVAGIAALAANTLIGDNINKLSMKEFLIKGHIDNPEIIPFNNKNSSK